jgi:hypothetical protein
MNIGFSLNHCDSQGACTQGRTQLAKTILLSQQVAGAALFVSSGRATPWHVGQRNIQVQTLDGL